MEAKRQLPRSSSLFLFLFLSVIIPACSANVTSMKRGGKCFQLNKQVFGINSAFVRTNVAYNNPAVEYYMASRNIQVLRFPGGTVSSTFSMLTGKAQCPRATRCDGVGCTDYKCDIKEGSVRPNGCYSPVRCGREYPTSTLEGEVKFSFCKTRANVLRFRGPAGLQLDEINKLIKSSIWKARSFVVPLNVCGMSPEETSLVVAKIAQMYNEAGIDNPEKYVKFELGNELYLTKYAYCVDNGQQYVALAKKHLDAVKSVGEKFQVAILISPSCYKSQPFARYTNWNREMATASLQEFDAVTIHLYSKTNIAPTDAETFQRHASYMDSRYPAAMRYLTAKYAKPIWITEWHMSGNSGDEDPTTKGNINTPPDVLWGYFGALYRVLGLTHMFATPEVKMTNFHSFDKMLLRMKNTAEISPKCQLASSFVGSDFTANDDAEAEFLRRSEVVKTQDMPQVIFSKVFENACQLAQRITFSDLNVVPKAGCSSSIVFNPVPFPELSGVMFRKCGADRKGIAIIVSKTEKEYEIDMNKFMCPFAPPSRTCKKIKLVTMYSRVPQEPREFAVEQVRPQSTKFTLKAFGVAAVEFSGNTVC